MAEPATTLNFPGFVDVHGRQGIDYGQNGLDALHIHGNAVSFRVKIPLTTFAIIDNRGRLRRFATDRADDSLD